MSPQCDHKLKHIWVLQQDNDDFLLPTVCLCHCASDAENIFSATTSNRLLKIILTGTVPNSLVTFLIYIIKLNIYIKAVN